MSTSLLHRRVTSVSGRGYGSLLSQGRRRTVIPGLRNVALHRRRPCESRDPYAVSLMLRVNVDILVAPSRYIRKRQGVWVPALAGTTKNRHSGATEHRAPSASSLQKQGPIRRVTDAPGECRHPCCT